MPITQLTLLRPSTLPDADCQMQLTPLESRDIQLKACFCGLLAGRASKHQKPSMSLRLACVQPPSSAVPHTSRSLMLCSALSRTLHAAGSSTRPLATDSISTRRTVCTLAWLATGPCMQSGTQHVLRAVCVLMLCSAPSRTLHAAPQSLLPLPPLPAPAPAPGAQSAQWLGPPLAPACMQVLALTYRNCNAGQL